MGRYGNTKKQDEINLKIAKLWGYYPHELNGEWILVAPHSRTLSEADYEWLHGAARKHNSEADCWNEAPNYTVDANAAMELLFSITDDLTPRIVRILTPVNGEMRHAYKAGILWNDGSREGIEEYANTYEMAACKAWLALKGEKIED
jgi:hypothetical protein